MVMIESTGLIDNLSLLLKMSQEFRIHETSEAYEDVIRLVMCMENEFPGGKRLWVFPFIQNIQMHSWQLCAI